VDRSTDTPAEPAIEPRRIPIAGVAAIAAAITVNILVYLIARAVGAVPDVLPDSMDVFGIGPIVFIVVLTLTVAMIAMLGFTRFSATPIRNFTILSVIVFVTSLPPVFGLEGLSPGFKVTLVIMHAVTALIAWWTLTRLPVAR
jgi:hypothetical protein